MTKTTQEPVTYLTFLLDNKKLISHFFVYQRLYKMVNTEQICLILILKQFPFFAPCEGTLPLNIFGFHCWYLGFDFVYY